jgi:hypothetical protein
MANLFLFIFPNTMASISIYVITILVSIVGAKLVSTQMKMNMKKHIDSRKQLLN